jgi:hypothetical protein
MYQKECGPLAKPPRPRLPCYPQHCPDADAKLARNAADACALVAHGADRSDLGRVGVLKGLAAEPLRQSQEKIRGVGW